MRVRLVRKLADLLDGIDVSAYRSGDVVDLSRRDAELLIAEQWAVPVSVPVLRRMADHYQRRAEDRIKEELPDSSETTSQATGDPPPVADDTRRETERDGARNPGGERDAGYPDDGDSSA
jgi:hypothetical protein